MFCKCTYCHHVIEGLVVEGKLVDYDAHALVCQELGVRLDVGRVAGESLDM